MVIPSFILDELPDLKGERCVLRPLRPEHVTPAYVSWLNDPEINRYLESRFTTHTLESTRDFVAAQWRGGNVFFYGIWVPQPGAADRHVGNIKLGPVDRTHLTADIGFLIGDREQWGKGIASEAIALLVGLGCQFGICKITAGAYENNPGSAKALTKAGFSLEGMRPNQVISGSERVGVSLFGMSCC
jgi:[ribosomal protein S5]-alanine N-acetyltransferase